MQIQNKALPLHPQSRNDANKNKGTLADRLGNGLQNRVEQFDSARYLNRSENLKHFKFSLLIFHPSKISFSVITVIFPAISFVFCQERRTFAFQKEEN